MNIGERIRKLRKQNNINQSDLASVLKNFYGLGTDRVAVSKWETGFQLPNIEAVKCIADYFGVSADYLIKDGQHFERANVIPCYRNYPDDNCDGCIRSDVDADFCIIASDDAMRGAGIVCGANVFIKKHTQLKNGQIVLVETDNTSYIRRYYINDDIVFLVAENNNFPPLVFKSNRAHIVGKVCSVQFFLD